MPVQRHHVGLHWLRQCASNPRIQRSLNENFFELQGPVVPSAWDLEPHRI